MPGKFSSCQKATAIAILFHGVGLIGLLFFDRRFFLSATSGNLLLMGVLLIWTQKEKNRSFYLFLVICLVIGMVVEVIGVRSALLFGHYSYGWMMGFQIMDTPLIVGVNWFIVIYCSATCLCLLKWKKPWTGWIIGGGALLATLCDWLMEPVADKLGYWKWNGAGTPPVYNYVSWFVISALLLSVFHYSKFQKSNRFAANLILIQVLFFLILRIALN